MLSSSDAASVEIGYDSDWQVEFDRYSKVPPDGPREAADVAPRRLRPDFYKAINEAARFREIRTRE